MTLKRAYDNNSCVILKFVSEGDYKQRACNWRLLNRRCSLAVTSKLFVLEITWRLSLDAGFCTGVWNIAMSSEGTQVLMSAASVATILMFHLKEGVAILSYIPDNITPIPVRGTLFNSPPSRPRCIWCWGNYCFAVARLRSHATFRNSFCRRRLIKMHSKINCCKIHAVGNESGR